MRTNQKAWELTPTQTKILNRLALGLTAAASVLASGLTATSTVVAEWVPITFGVVAGLLTLGLVIDLLRER